MFLYLPNQNHNSMGYPYEFHDTVGDPLVDTHEVRAKGQAEIILDYFRAHPGESFTPHQILDLAFSKVSKKPEIVSVRRAMTNLTVAGKLIKEKKKRMEKHGCVNNTWTARLEVRQLSLI